MVTYIVKVHIFWEGHKISWNLHCIFDRYYSRTVEILQKFVAFSEYMNFIRNINWKTSSDVAGNYKRYEQFCEGGVKSYPSYNYLIVYQKLKF